MRINYKEIQKMNRINELTSGQLKVTVISKLNTLDPKDPRWLQMDEIVSGNWAPRDWTKVLLTGGVALSIVLSAILPALGF